MKKLGGIILLVFTIINGFCADTLKTQKFFPVKVVVITMFENGEDTGDSPGEFQYWVERLPLTTLFLSCKDIVHCVTMPKSKF
jgi:purine nucleoside permease